MDVDRTKQHRQDNTGTSKEAEELSNQKLFGEMQPVGVVPNEPDLGHS